jgi:hypothetical membrane protein
MIIAWSVYPVPYSLHYNDISDLGGLVNNPEGHFWYNLAAIVCGFMLLPHMHFLYHRLREIAPQHPKFERYGYGAGMASISFFIMHAVIQQDYGFIHRFFAYFCFITIIIASIADFLALQDFVQLPQKQKKKFLLYICTLLLNGAFFGMLIALIIASIMGQSTADVYSPWEWANLFAVMIWLISMTLILETTQSKPAAQ